MIKVGRKNDYRGRIPNQVSIDARPPVVDEKTRFGDMEIDLVVGKNHKGKLLTINDRASSIEWIRKVDRQRPRVCKARVDSGDEDKLNKRPRKRVDYMTPKE